MNSQLKFQNGDNSKCENQREGEKKIVMVEGRQKKKVGSSAAEAAGTMATSQQQQTGSKRVKTQAEKDRHNESCRKSRQKLKKRRTDLEMMETKYTAIINEMKDENGWMKMALHSTNIAMDDMRKENEGLKRTLEEQGQSISILNKYVELFASQTFKPVSDYPNITASSAVSSLGANHDFSYPFDAPNNLLSHELAAYGDGAGYSSGANHNFSNVSDAFAPNGHNNIVDSATGVGTTFFVPNLHDNAGSFIDGPAAGSPF